MQLTDFNLALEPNLQTVFSKPATWTTQPDSYTSRELFYSLVHISEHYSALPRIYLFLKQHFKSVDQEFGANFSKNYSPTALASLLTQPAPTTAYPMTESDLNKSLVYYAPVYFTELSWLATSVQTATCQTPVALDLMSIYLRLTADELSIANCRQIYLAHLLTSGIEIPALHTSAFSNQADISDEMFDFACIQLALAQFPRAYFPEILGFTLYYCQNQSLLELFFSENCHPTIPDFLTTRTKKHQQEVNPVITIIKAYLEEFSSNKALVWQRIQTGVWLYHKQVERCSHCLTDQLHASLSPRQTMEKLLSKLTPNAIGHHGKIRLGGKTIDEWFKETPFKSANFLASFLHSPYVDRAKPENSKLLELFEFGGPMFGVIDDNGKAVIKQWLLSELNPGLPISKKHNLTNYKVGLKSITHHSTPNYDPITLELNEDHLELINYAKLCNREFFYFLVNNDRYPDVLHYAKKKVERILMRSKLVNRSPFSRYSHQAFTAFINNLYVREVESFVPLYKKPKLTKKAYQWGIEQFAPTILTDGCWLQQIHQLDFYSSHAIGALLHTIYLDEIGNGIQAQNHPHIYQELLNSLSIKVPAIYSKSFINYPGFIDSAFDIPVYLMAISKFPSAYLPELLGLNMAIEISGLGRVYLRLSEELKYWGINSAIVDIHTSIDNMSSGHSALAIKAIQTHLDDISACYGEDMMNAHWRRIYTGFCSLKTASTRFKFSLIGHYLLKRPIANNS